MTSLTWDNPRAAKTSAFQASQGTLIFFLYVVILRLPFSLPGEGDPFAFLAVCLSDWSLTF
jgi:hypothetical protein